MKWIALAASNVELYLSPVLLENRDGQEIPPPPSPHFCISENSLLQRTFQIWLIEDPWMTPLFIYDKASQPQTLQIPAFCLINDYKLNCPSHWILWTKCPLTSLDQTFRLLSFPQAPELWPILELKQALGASGSTGIQIKTLLTASPENRLTRKKDFFCSTV